MSTAPQAAITQKDPYQYAGFGLRFCSMFLDGLLYLPVLLLLSFVHLPGVAVLCMVLSLLIEAFVEVYLVQRFGGSPGKLLMGLRILQVDGTPVTYLQAILRAGPNLVFGLLGFIAFADIYFQTVEAERISGVVPNLKVVGPAWYDVVSVLQNVWNWGELLVLLTNQKRRALHDFIAGTIVVVVSKPGFRRPAPVVLPPVRV